MRNSNVWFRLTIEDIQSQAESEIGRRLADDEIQYVIHRAEQGIEWIDSVCIAIGML